MSGPRPVVWWQPVLTAHQAATVQQLAVAAGTPVTVVVAAREHAVRKHQGWSEAQVAALEVSVLPARGWLREVRRVLRAHRHAIHVFGSPFERPRLMLALLLALRACRRVYLVSEPYSTVGFGYLGDRAALLDRIKARLRPAVYRLYGAMLRRRVAGVFAISPRAVAQYRRSGVAPERIFPYGYFVERQAPSREAAPTATGAGDGVLRAVFVGSLIGIKGVDVLVEAARALSSRGAPVRVDLYGPGDPARVARDVPNLTYRGLIPFGRAQEVIARYDVLVLPSRYDGWGVVVNEALLAGAPVVCSDQVGAGAVVSRWRCGVVFPAGDAEALADALAALAREPARLSELRRAAGLAGETLLPAVAARYLADVLARDGEGPKPPCPWYDA